MKFVLNRVKLLEGLKLVSKVTPKTRTFVGSVNSVYFQIGKGQLFLWGTDGIRGLVTRYGVIESKESLQKADIVFPIDKLLHTVTYSTTEKVSFEESGDRRWKIKANSTSTVGTYSVDHFPKFETKGETLEMINIDNLKRYLKKVAPTADEESSDKPHLSGVLIDGNFVTTDIQRMSYYKTNYDTFKKSFIIPAGVLEVLNSFSGGSLDVEVRSVVNSLVFCVGDTLISTRLYEASFPNYKTVIERVQNFKYKMVMVDKKNFLEVMNRLKIFRDANNFVCLKIENDKMTIQVGTDDVGVEEIVVKSSESFSLTLDLNIDAVFDFLNVIDGEKVILKVLDDKTPVVVQEKYSNGEEFYSILSPLIRR